MNEETGGNMSKYYQGEKRLEEGWRRNVDYFKGQSSSKQIFPWEGIAAKTALADLTEQEFFSSHLEGRTVK